VAAEAVVLAVLGLLAPPPAFGLLVPEPAGDLVACTLEPAALVAVGKAFRAAAGKAALAVFALPAGRPSRQSRRQSNRS
jgi:hypothetical protein